MSIRGDLSPVEALDGIPVAPQPLESPKEAKAPAMHGTWKCALPDCPEMLTVRGLSNQRPRFCTVAHRNEYWQLCREIGDRYLSRILTSSGKSQTQQLLELLEETPNIWVARPLQKLPHIHCFSRRVSDLRKRGHDIRCRRVFREDVQQNEYQYKLVRK